jgi:alpha-ketoglutarate-dependent taurine dioxygenase
MRKKKLPGFGSLGGEMLDIDLASASEQEILELGFEHLHDLVTVVRKEQVGGISLERFHAICASWAIELQEGGYDQGQGHARLRQLYGDKWWTQRDKMTASDQELLDEIGRITGGVGHLIGMLRVTGIRDEQGNHTGMFADGELDWHSNQQGTKDFAPAVGLLACEGAGGSRTDFLNTVDGYQALSPAWQTTCANLVAVHRWRDGAIAPGLNGMQTRILQMNMCPEDDVEVPLVAISPFGHKGLHFSFETIHHFKGMSEKESSEIVSYLKNHLIRDEYIYSHEWSDGDLLFFDNTVTLHRRPTRDCSKRLMYRMCFNYDRLVQLRETGAEGSARKHQPVTA